jgi:hypothetical protein
MLKVLTDPLNREFSKDLPEGFKAVDVLQQYRLFFKVIDDSIVFFVWVNSEESLHRSGESDDCYAVFRKKLTRGEIETYQPQPEPEKRYRFHGTWTDPVVYAHYLRNTERADSYLHLSRVSANEYRIDSISVSTEDIGLASELLSHLCIDAAVANVILIHELFIKAESVLKSRHLLQKFGFSKIETIEDIEIWTRLPR